MADNTNKARPGEPNPATTEPSAMSSESNESTAAKASPNASMRATLRWPYRSFDVSSDIPPITNEGTMLTKTQAEKVAEAAKASGVEVDIEEVNK